VAINFTRTFTTLGLLCGGLNEVNTYRATTLGGRKTDILSQFGTVAAYGELVTGVYSAVDNALAAENGFVSWLGQTTQSVVVNEVVADRPLASESLANALAELDRQMRVASESLNECPGTVAVADVGSPTGDHKFVFGVKEALTGRTTDFLVPDVYLIRCTADRSQGGTAYAETFSLVGKQADQLPTDSTYPSGTGLDTTVTAVDPASDGGVVTDPDFDEWTGTGNNTPVRWSVYGSTVAGTHVLRATDDPRGGAGTSLSLVGDGSVLVRLRQAISVEANTVYTAHMRVKKVADPGTDWAVSMMLVDSSGTAVAGNGSYSNVVSSAAATSVAGNWTNAVTGVFCTPAVLPSGGVYLEIRFHQSGSTSTAPASTANAYVDYVSVVETTPLYSGGPTLTAFSGSTEGVVGDTRTATVALTTGVPGDYLIRGIDRLLSGGLASAAVRLPTSNTPTQADALVT
jgi:hypothetical protein